MYTGICSCYPGLELRPIMPGIFAFFSLIWALRCYLAGWTGVGEISLGLWSRIRTVLCRSGLQRRYLPFQSSAFPLWKTSWCFCDSYSRQPTWKCCRRMGCRTGSIWRTHCSTFYGIWFPLRERIPDSPIWSYNPAFHPRSFLFQWGSSHHSKAFQTRVRSWGTPLFLFHWWRLRRLKRGLPNESWASRRILVSTECWGRTRSGTALPVVSSGCGSGILSTDPDRPAGVCTGTHHLPQTNKLVFSCWWYLWWQHIKPQYRMNTHQTHLKRLGQ